MHKRIVRNFLTLDGLYEGRDKNIISLYDYLTRGTVRRLAQEWADLPAVQSCGTRVAGMYHSHQPVVQ